MKKPSIPTIYQNAGLNVALHAKKSGPDVSAYWGKPAPGCRQKVPGTLGAKVLDTLETQ